MATGGLPGSAIDTPAGLWHDGQPGSRGNHGNIGRSGGSSPPPVPSSILFLLEDVGITSS